MIDENGFCRCDFCKGYNGLFDDKSGNHPSCVEKNRQENLERGLTLATLCDMVLGEDAEDRSDDALIRRVRLLQTFWDTH